MEIKKLVIHDFDESDCFSIKLGTTSEPKYAHVQPRICIHAIPPLFFSSEIHPRPPRRILYIV